MNEEQKKLAVKLGLGEDATVEQLNEKLQADALASLETPEPDPAPEPDPSGDPPPEPQQQPVRRPGGRGSRRSSRRAARPRGPHDAAVGARRLSSSTRPSATAGSPRVGGRVAGRDPAGRTRPRWSRPRCSAREPREEPHPGRGAQRRRRDEGEQSTHAQIMAAAYGIDVTAGRGA
jgi:hypothetical protein